MPKSMLLQLVRDGDLEGFESLCLEALESKQVSLPDLVAPFNELEKLSKMDRAATIGQMILDNTDPQAAPDAALRIACVSLAGDPKNADLRQRVVGLYGQVHGDRPGFAALLDASGLAGDRPPRNAIRMIDSCLKLEVGDALISRTEDVVVEVKDIDLEHGLITLQHPRRPLTITPVELSSEYERIASSDFRVLRAFKPDELAKMVQDDPVAVVVGLIHAHGEMIDQEVVKHELVPKYLEPKQWSKWWTRARPKLQRDPHVIVEGRNPILLRYTEEVRTLEDETWENFCELKDAPEWQSQIESYLREKKKRKETPDVELLGRCRVQLEEYRTAIKHLRPSDAFATALLIDRIDEIIAPDKDAKHGVADETLIEAKKPVKLISRLEDESLWTVALAALEEARPDDAPACAAELIPLASATQLDRLTKIARKGEMIEFIQAHIDTALADPLNYPELIFWLWKGPRQTADLNLPSDDELFDLIMRMLYALGRRINPSVEIMKRFRHRMRTALALRAYKRACECIQRVEPEAAITLRTRLERLDGVGDNVRYRLLNALRDAHPQVFIVKKRRIQPWEDQDVLWNTPEGIARKTEERDHLVNVTMHENAKRIGEAASHGDLSENSEYKFALEERDFLRGRLAQMNEELSKAEALEPHHVPDDHVGVGSRVTVRDHSEGATRQMTFLGPFDTDVDNGVFNYRAPVSQELMGLHVGERRTITLDNQPHELEVIEIASGLTVPQ